ncbi:hypothetical protein CDAR_607781 [Caerostris darwini]|uniref:Uncharacterized protein n=1 Tax=Caerostris darwini TaxID=1538125 RepID=A0AAV4UL47_9ARAC|nr:hypothetical protein CDAR_607781 [Caerostris darwini]
MRKTDDFFTRIRLYSIKNLFALAKRPIDVGQRWVQAQDATRKWVKVSVDAMLKSKGKVNKKPPPLPFLPVSQVVCSEWEEVAHRTIETASLAASERVRTWVCERTTSDARK